MTDYSIISENDKQFADEFSRFVNGKMSSAKKTGIEFANDHRFLVNEKFKKLNDILASDKALDVAWIAVALFFFAVAFAACLLRVG